MSWKIGMPNLGHTMEEGKVAEWLKGIGDPVGKGEVIAIVESDKANFDVESPAEGVLMAIEAEAGSIVPIGTTIGVVGSAAELSTQRPQTPASAVPGDPQPAGPAKMRVRVKVGSAPPPSSPSPLPAPVVATRSNDIPSDKLVGFWREMVRIRSFERAAAYQSSLGKIYGALHSYEGEESCAVGICSALDKGDYVSSTHRGHGHTLAVGARMDRMMAELFGRADGYCKGKGGSLHIADVSAGMLGANGIVGAGYAIAAGAALNAKVTRNGRVSVVFFGDGAVTRGTFHEVMNMASLWKLPLLLVCENNGLAQYVPTSETMVFDSVAGLAGNYRMRGIQIDGNDIRLVHTAATEAVARARAGDGPTLIELKTQRFLGHSSGDPQVYRTKTAVEELRNTRDPIARLEAELVSAGLLDDRDALLAGVDAEVEEAIRFAEASPYPADEEFGRDVYA